MDWDSRFLDQFDQSGQTLHGLPSNAYTSENFFALESAEVFSRCWVFAGFAHQIEKVGDARPVTVGGLPLFLVRGKDHQIRAFHNACRHRNLKLIDEKGNAGKIIQCPYHCWTYELDGRLRHAPYFGGSNAHDLPADFRLEDNGLLPVHCKVWHDWVFVNLAEEPADFEAFLAPIKRQLGATDVTQFVPVATVDFGDIKCNWKLLMENFIEPYHVSFVHKDTTDQPLTSHYTVIDEHCLGSAVELGKKELSKVRKGTLGVTSHYLTLFPNFVLGTYQPNQLGVHLNTPVNVAKTAQQRVIYMHAHLPCDDQQVQAAADLWHKVHLEDHEMCERLQAGRYSPVAAAGGFLSPHWENSLRKFQELVAESVRPRLNPTDERGQNYV